MMGSTRDVGSTELQNSNRWKDRGIIPERTMVKKVAVVYYLTRNGQLQQPHFMEVNLSNHGGLYLKDVVARLTILRGEGMASMYSWSCKRSYGKGFVWQDLTENDFIYPTTGHEYVLKGSELLHFLIEAPPIVNQARESSSPASSRSSDIHDTSKKVDSPVVINRRNQSCSSIDMYEYKLYKTTAKSVSVGDSVAANASTQTESNKHHDFSEKESEKEIEAKADEQEACENDTVELSRGEITPPPSDSSPETLETLMKVDKRLMLRTGALNGNGHDQTFRNSSHGKMKASAVLMQLFSCGSFPFKDCGAIAVKDHGLSLVSSYKSKLPHTEKHSSYTGVKLEGKEYFSGSLVQNKSECDDELIKLKRSFSCNADRKSRLGLEEADKVLNGTKKH